MRRMSSPEPDWVAIANRSGCVHPATTRPLVWLSVDEDGDHANPGDAREWQVDIPVGGGGTFQTLPEAMEFAIAEVNHALQHPGHRALMGRGWSTPKWRDPVTGSTRLRVHRACNGCGRDLGNPTDAEMAAALAGRPLPDTREECGCS